MMQFTQNVVLPVIRKSQEFIRKSQEWPEYKDRASPLGRYLPVSDILQRNSNSGILDTASPCSVCVKSGILISETHRRSDTSAIRSFLLPLYVFKPFSILSANSADSPVVNPDGKGVGKYLLFSAGQRLAVTFDQATLDDQWEYVRDEARKDVGVVKGWQYLLNEIKGRNVFTLSALELKKFLRELHRLTYPGTSIYSRARPGEFRSPQGGLASCRVKKTSDALASASGILFKDAFLKEYYHSKGLPDIPTCVLQGLVYDPVEGEDIRSYLAISAQCCAELLDFPPKSEAELKERLLKEPERFQPSLEELNENIKDWELHSWTTSDWVQIKEDGLFSRPPSATEWVNYSALYDYQEVITNLRTLPPPREMAEAMVDSWCEHAEETIKNIRSDRELFKQVAILLCELMTIRPFNDGNCRIAVLILQGLLMTFGYPPIRLKTRYIFNLGPDEIAKLIEDAVNKKIPEADQAVLPDELVSSVAGVM